MTGIRWPWALCVALCLFVPTTLAAIDLGGRAVAKGGLPIPEANVFLLRLLDPVSSFRLESALSDGLKPLARAKTDAAGYFDLSAPDCGVYLIRIEAPGYVPVESRLAPLLEPLELPDAQLSRDIGLTVRTVGPNGNALAEARVRLSTARQRGPRRSATAWTVAQQQGVTAADGTLRLAHSGSGDPVLTVSAPGYQIAERVNVRGGSATVRLEAGREREIEVRSIDGKAVAGALVEDSDHEHPLGLTSQAGKLRVALPAKDGIKISVRAPDGRRAEGLVTALPKDSKPESRRFVLPKLSAVSGRLIDAENHKPIAGGWIWRNEEVWSAVPSDSSGSYTMYVPDRRNFELAAGATGYLPPDPIDVRPDGPESAGPSVALRPAAAIEGTVVNAAGDAVAGASLALEEKRGGGNMVVIRAGGPRAPNGSSSSRGRFRLSAVDPMKGYDLEARALGYAPATTEILGLEPRKVVRGVRLTLEEGRRVTGRTVDAGGRPVGNVEISLHPSTKSGRGPGMIVLGGPRAEPIVTFSDTEGRFAAAGLRPQIYDLSLRRNGFARKTISAIDVKDGPEPTGLGDVVLEPGERIQGRVVDPQGRPIEGVSVSVVESDQGAMFEGIHSMAPETREGDAMSGPDGWFSVFDLRAGEDVQLAFNRKGYLAARQTGVKPPTVDRLQITLSPSSKITGTVLNDRNAPIPGAEVTLEISRSAGGGGSLFRFISRESATTDDGGNFAFNGVEPGKVALTATSSGWQEARLDALEVPRGDDLQGIEFRLKPGSIVTGRVLAPDGRPAPGAEVGLVKDQPEMVRFRGTLTDGDGNYRLEGIEPGRVSIEATHEKYVRAVRDLDAKPGANALDLQLEGGQEVSGTVVDPAGAPVAGAWVHLGARGSDWGFHETTTRPDGRFVVVGVSDGDYQATAGRAGFAAFTKGENVSVQGNPVSDVQIRLDAGVTLRGRITGLAADSLARVELRAMSPSSDSSPAGAVDREGNYRLDDLAAGAWTVVASERQSGEQTRGEVTIERGSSEAHLDLEFGKGIRLTGRVTRGEIPLVGATLFVRGTTVEHSAWSRSDREGGFAISGLKPGSYRIEVRQWDTGLSYEENVELSSSREIAIEIPTACIIGIVVDAADGKPVSGATVTLSPPQARSEPSFLAERGVTTDLEGRFRIEDIADGEWRLTAQSSGHATYTTDVPIRNGRGPENLRLALQATEGLTLQIQLPSGRPPREVQAAVLDSNGGPLARGTYTTGENGTVRLTSVPSGTWEVLVAAGGTGTATLQASSPGVPVTVQLPPACSVRVKVPGLSKAGIPAVVSLRTASGRPYRAMAWFGDPIGEWGLTRGETLIDAIPPGTWTVEVTASDGRTWRSDCTTSPGAEATVILE